MTPARKLIEEARRRLVRGLNEAEVCHVADLLDEALALLPDWQEFDPKREETWPKENDGREWIVVVEICAGEPEVSTDWWVGKWNGYSPNAVKCYQPLPPPYEK